MRAGVFCQGAAALESPEASDLPGLRSGRVLREATEPRMESACSRCEIQQMVLISWLKLVYSEAAPDRANQFQSSGRRPNGDRAMSSSRYLERSVAPSRFPELAYRAGEHPGPS